MPPLPRYLPDGRPFVPLIEPEGAVSGDVLARDRRMRTIGLETAAQPLPPAISPRSVCPAVPSPHVLILAAAILAFASLPVLAEWKPRRRKTGRHEEREHHDQPEDLPLSA
jgi:hypothetical protein